MNTAATSHVSLGRPRRRREHVLAAILISALILVFLGTPLRAYRTSLYTPADVTQDSSLTRVEPDHRVGNPLLGPVVLQIQSWLLYGRDEIRRGEMPLWNPYNGGGRPLLANYQSALLSPFSLPYYVLRLKDALLLAAFLKLFGLGFFTYLFLREIELVFLAALTGGVAFMCAGFNVLLLGYPHSAAMVTLPLGLLFVERACRRFERGPGTMRARTAGDPAPRDSKSRDSFLRDPTLRDIGMLPFLGLAVALVMGLLSGQPVPLYFAVLLIALYAASRLSSMWIRSRRDRSSLFSIVRLAGAFVLVAGLAAGIAAVQIVPFLEYVDVSRLLEQPSHGQRPLSLLTWPLLMYPNLLGNPATNYQVDAALPPPDFETANLVYSGGIVLFLSLLSLLFVNRNRYHAFFACAALVWVVYAYDIGGAWRLFALVPTVELLPIDKSQGIPAFCLAACAAFAVHHFVHVRVPVRSMLFASTLFAGLVLLATFLFGAQHLAVETYAHLKAVPGREAIYQYSTPHLLHVSLAFLPGLLALSAMLLAPQGQLRRIFTGVILLSVFLQTGHLLRNYNPTCEERFVFPRTPAVSELAAAVGPNTVAVLGDDALLPDGNLSYRIALPASRDGIGIARYDRLFGEVFGASDERRTMSRASLQGLELFGVDYVLSKGAWLSVDAPMADVGDQAEAFYETGEILPGHDVVQTFTGTHDRLQAVRVSAGSLGHAGACTLHLALEDPSDGRTIAARDFDCRRLPADAASKTSLVFGFEPIADSRGRSFRLRASSPDAQAGAGVSLWCRSDWRHWVNLALWRATLERTLVPSAPPTVEHQELDGWRLSMGNETLDGGLYFDTSSSRAAFHEVRPIGEHTLFAIADSPSRFHWVGRAIPVDGDEQAFARVQSPDFDPKVSVVLDRRDTDATAPARDGKEPSPVQVLEEAPTRIRLKLEHAKPGWLVLAKPWYPGWIARVDGEERELVRANYAFSALRIAAGESQVELEYDAPSFRRGLWISGLSLVSLALYLSLLGLRSRRQRPAV